MKPHLLGQLGDAAPTTQRHLVIGMGDFDVGCAVSAQVFERQLLTSVHDTTIEKDLWETTLGKPRLDRENPFLREKELQRLDEQGLAPVGSVVGADQVLASLLATDNRPPVQGAEAAKGMQWVTDESIRVPPGWGGSVVTTAQRRSRKGLGRGAPRGLLEHLEITLQIARPLEVGDMLQIDDESLTVASVAQDPPRDREGRLADILVPPDVGDRLGITRERFCELQVSKDEQGAGDALKIRGIGPYSLITQMPLDVSWPACQSITTAHVEWLAERGLSSLLGEFVSLKSDNVVDRPQLHTLLTLPPGSVLDLARPAAPQSLALVMTHLMALGLQVTVEEDEGHLALRIQAASDTEILKHSSGEITKPETIHYRTYADVDYGLFAPNVFGPSDWSRREKFGHIQLAVPIVPILWRTGEPSYLSRVLGISNRDLKRLVNHQVDLFWEQDAPRLQKHDLANASAPNCLGTGAAAIQKWLTQQSLPTFPVVQTLRVLPPDWRPLVLLDSGNFATADVNDLYCRIINRNNRLKKLVQLGAPPVILDNEAQELQQAVDQLYGNALFPKSQAVFGSGEHKLIDVLTMLQGEFDYDSKRVDWSAAARLLPDSALADHQVLVPRAVFETLRLGQQLPILLTTSAGDGRFLARLPRVHDQRVVRVSPNTYRQLATDSPAVVQIHRPVTTAGVAEAKSLVDGSPAFEILPEITPSWATSQAVEELAERLAIAVTSGERVPFTSPQNLLVAGTGSKEVAADAPNPQREPTRLQARIPAEKQPQSVEPSAEQLLDVVREHRRKSCVFDVVPTSTAPPAAAGRIGGEPLLPADIEWPHYKDKPLTFLGQFPLDAARDAGILPIDVPPRSMLSIFGGDDCWEPGPCQARCPVFIHSQDNLVERSAPNELEYIAPLCQITPRIVEESPAAVELTEILHDEFGDIKRPVLQAFLQSLPPNLALAGQCIKIGGWPHWIQGADSAQPLLLQIASSDEVDFGFGDSGTLYIFVGDSGELNCFTQCY